MRRLEPALIGLFLASWVCALLAQLRLLDLAGTFPLAFYPYFSLAAALGWVAGNVYVHRRRAVPRPLRRRLLLSYLVGPPGLRYRVTSGASPMEMSGK